MEVHTEIVVNRLILSLMCMDASAVVFPRNLELLDRAIRASRTHAYACSTEHCLAPGHAKGDRVERRMVNQLQFLTWYGAI